MIIRIYFFAIIINFVLFVHGNQVSNVWYKILSKIPNQSSESLESIFTINLDTQSEWELIIYRISDAATKATDTYTEYIQNTKNTLANISMSPALLSTFDKIFLKIDHINEYTDQLINTQSISKEDAKEFAKSLDDLQDILDEIKDLAIGETVGDSGALHFLHYEIKTSPYPYYCNINATEQELFIQLYEALIATEIKGYILNRFLCKINDQPFNNEKYTQRIKEYDTFLVLELKETMTSLLRCFPLRHIEGKTYERFTRLIEGYVENERNLNSGDSCWDDCSQKNTEAYACENDSCFHPQCRGKVLHCLEKKIDEARVCASSHAQAYSRRYEFVAVDGQVYLNTRNCTGDNEVGYSKQYFNLCSYCFCFCHEPDSDLVDRYFDLHGAVSNLQNHEIVTGVRFVKRRQVIFLQIQVGVLVKGGNVDPKSVKWQPINEYDIWNKRLKPGQNYYAFSPVDDAQMALDLENVMATNGFVVTGVRFRERIDELNGKSFLALDIHATAINLRTGGMDGPGRWIENNKPKQELKLNGDDIPTLAMFRNIPNIYSLGGNYIKFTHSGVTEDAAQTTIPYIDAQPVIVDPPTPLSGVGLYYKAKKNSGGFVGPQIFTFNFGDESVLFQETSAAGNLNSYNRIVCMAVCLVSSFIFIHLFFNH